MDHENKKLHHAKSFDFSQAGFTKKKESESVTIVQTSDTYNACIYEIDSSGKPEKIAAFTQDYSQVKSLSWFSKQELFISDLHSFTILNIQTGTLTKYAFPNHTQILQCCTDNLEHPIVTRSIAYICSDKLVYWDYVLPIQYNCMSFLNTKEIW